MKSRFGNKNPGSPRRDDGEDSESEKEREQERLTKVVGALFSPHRTVDVATGNVKNKGKGKVEALARKRRKTDPIPAIARPLSLFPSSVPAFTPSSGPAFATMSSLACSTSSGTLKDSANTVLAAKTIDKAAKRSKHRKNMHWSSPKKGGRKSYLDTQHMKVDAVTEYVMWEVLQGYNGPCNWPMILEDGVSASDVCAMIRSPLILELKRRFSSSSVPCVKRGITGVVLRSRMATPGHKTKWIFIALPAKHQCALNFLIYKDVLLTWKPI